MDSPQLVSILTYAFLGVFGALVGALVWFLNRTVSQIDKLGQNVQSVDLRVQSLEIRQELAGDAHKRSTDGTR